MGRKDTIKTPLLINKSLATSFTGPVTIIQYMDNCSYQINVTTTNSAGTFQVEVSDDYTINQGVVTNPGNWITLSLSATPTVAAANDVIGISLNQVPYSAIRIAYTSNTAGTGTCSIYISDKQVGG